MVLGERRKEVGRRQLLLAGLEVQLVAQWGILRDGDDRRFAGVAFLTLDALFAFFSALALFATLSPRADGSLRAGVTLGTDGTAVGPKGRDIAIRIGRAMAVPTARTPV